MKMPLIIYDGDDVGFYDDKEYAEGYLEAIDVEQGTYQGFDAEAHPLFFTTYRSSWWSVASQVRIEADMTSTNEPELRRVLTRYLQYDLTPIRLINQSTLAQLIDLARLS